MKRTLLSGLILIGAAAIVALNMHIDMETAAYAEQQSSSEAYADVQSTPGSVAQSTFDPFKPGPQNKTRKKTVTVYALQQREAVIDVPENEQRSQDYADLMLQKAQRMTEEELEAAIKDAKGELDAQNEAADAELQQAVDILEQLVKQSPGTPAAERARLALTVLNGPMPTRRSPEPTPVPAEPAPIHLH